MSRRLELIRSPLPIYGYGVERFKWGGWHALMVYMGRYKLVIHLRRPPNT